MERTCARSVVLSVVLDDSCNNNENYNSNCCDNHNRAFCLIFRIFILLLCRLFPCNSATAFGTHNCFIQ